VTGAPLFETIVVGVDGRKGGGDALRLGQQLAEAAGGALIAVRVFPYQYRPAVKGAPAVEERRRSTEAALDRELSDAESIPRAHAWSATPPPLARCTGSSTESEPTCSSSAPRTAAGSGACWPAT